MLGLEEIIRKIETKLQFVKQNKQHYKYKSYATDSPAEKQNYNELQDIIQGWINALDWVLELLKTGDI